jgi:hypothetical protein
MLAYLNLTLRLLPRVPEDTPYLAISSASMEGTGQPQGRIAPAESLFLRLLCLIQ